MDVSTRIEAVGAARDVLRRFRAENPGWQDDQTPVEEIANWLGCEVATFHPSDYPGGTYGFLEPNDSLIWLCRDLSPAFRRFTLAHEVGHVVLHSHLEIGHNLPLDARSHFAQADEMSLSSDDLCYELDVDEEAAGMLFQQTTEELLGPALAYDPRSRRELAANLFAAELLMPLERVWELYVVQSIAPDLLAARFGVSLSALFNRLASLFSELPEHALSEQPAPEMPETLPIPQPASAKKPYDEFQRAAIETSTPALVVAGPGSGKTSTLIGRAEYLLREQGVRSDQILALTFSRKAAQEMQERLQQILSVDQSVPTVSTFHAFCANLLRTHGQRIGLRQDFALVDDAEGYFLLRGLAGSLELNHYQDIHRPSSPFKDFLKAISRAKDELITPARYRELAREMLERATGEEEQSAAERALEVATVYDLYQQRLMQRGDSDFGGLIMSTVQLLNEHPDIHETLLKRYQHILVDEFQDINRASGILLRLLAGEQKNIWVVGDANQSIYAFRGASPANIGQFHHDYPDARVLPLSRNYRSRPDIVRLADGFKQALLEQDERIGEVQTARAAEHEPYVILAQAADESQELRGLVRDIQRQLAQGYACRDIVVLCRTRALARKVTGQLARAGLPVQTRVGMMEQEHTKNMLSLLLLLVNGSGMGLLRAARLPAHQMDQVDIEALLLEIRERRTSLLSFLLHEEIPLTLSPEGTRAWTCLSGIMKNLLRESNSVWALLARYLLVETSMGRDLLLAGEDERARTMRADYAVLLQLAHTYDQRRLEEQHRLQVIERAASESPDAPAEEPGAAGSAAEDARHQEEAEEADLREQISGFLEYLQILLSLRQDVEGKREEESAASESEPDVLRVMTVHASKGLEFPIVYLPGLARNRFPAIKKANTMPPPVGMLPSESEGEGAHESSEACLFYVGATRARDQLILSYSERYGKVKARRSGYVDALITGLPDERVQRILWQAPLEEGASAQLEMQEEDGQASMTGPQPSQQFIAAMQPALLNVHQIEEYQKCPRRFMYGTIYGFRGDDGTFLPFWQTTDATMQALARRAELPSALDESSEVEELFQHFWHAHGDADGPFAQLYMRHGREVAARLQRELQEQQDANWQLRQKIEVDLAGHRVEVTIDRVEIPLVEGQPVKFVRTRYGKRKSKPEPGTRDLLYMHATRQQSAGQLIELEIHNLSTGERQEMKLGSRKAENLQRDFEQAAQGIQSQEYSPRPNARECPICPFYLICPA